MRGGSLPSTSGVYSQSETDSYTGSELDEAWTQQLEEITGRINSESDRTGFLRMVNRNHVFNSSNYSLGSLFRYLFIYEYSYVLGSWGLSDAFTFW